MGCRSTLPPQSNSPATIQLSRHNIPNKRAPQDILPVPLQLDADGGTLRYFANRAILTPSAGDSAANICSAVDDLAASDLSFGIKPGAALLFQSKWAAFDLDSSCTCGRVALFYAVAETQPQVWFQDLACQWHFLAASFADYFRCVSLMPSPLHTAVVLGILLSVAVAMRVVCLTLSRRSLFRRLLVMHLGLPNWQ
jgi:hypothetical protein